MTSALKFVPVEELGIHLRRPTPRWRKIVRKDTDCYRQIHSPGIVVFAEQLSLLQIETRLGCSRVGEPKQRDLVEHVVAAQHVFRVPRIPGTPIEDVV